LLDRSAGGIIFTTVQKFSPQSGEEHFPQLTNRRNVIMKPIAANMVLMQK